MKVAQVCARYAPFVGGVETHVRMISESLRSRGLEIEVLTTDPTWRLPAHSVVNGVTVRRFKAMAPADSYYFAPGLYEYLKGASAEYDLVHAHSYHSFPSLFAALAKDTTPLVFTPHYHGTGHTRVRGMAHVPYRRLGRVIFDRSDRIICVSNYELNLLSATFRRARGKASVIPNGVDTGELVKVSRPSVHTGVVVYVGRLERYKRIENIIKAVPLLKEGVRLVIIGVGPDADRLRRVISNLSLGNRVSMIGYLPREELLEQLARADAVISLSRHEAFGVTIAEALHIGIPCVVSGDSALVEFANGENCVAVTDVENPSEVAEAISKAICGGTVQFDFPSWTEVADMTVEVYSEFQKG
jgi:glycosyltransferase involved in cell wall biosynthesis